jgi:hypothetical protein
MHQYIMIGREGEPHVVFGFGIDRTYFLRTILEIEFGVEGERKRVMNLSSMKFVRTIREMQNKNKDTCCNCASPKPKIVLAGRVGWKFILSNR